jgi:GDP-L-fucose synthase
MCESYNRQYGSEYISIIPTNVYGPNQRYEPMNSFVVPSLIDKFYKAKEATNDSVSIWGTGKPIRDFIYVDDLADASIFLMEEYEGNVLLNIGTGRKCSIAELAEIVRKEVGFKGRIIFDPSKPDGVPEKSQDLSKITSLGWRPKIDLEKGIHLSYQHYMSDCIS